MAQTHDKGNFSWQREPLLEQRDFGYSDGLYAYCQQMVAAATARSNDI
jgi:hypothetical protein